MKISPSVVALFLVISLTGVFTFALGRKSIEISKLSDELKVLREEVKGAATTRPAVESFSGELKQVKTQPQTAVGPDEPISPSVFIPGKAHLDDPFWGDKSSPLLIMEFADYQSKPCRSFAQESLAKLRSDFVDTKKAVFILRDFPLGKHPRARLAAALAQCAGEQAGYWKAFDALNKADFTADDNNLTATKKKFTFADKTKLEKCIKLSRYDREIDLDIEEGRKLGVKGAPGFFVGIKEKTGNYSGVLIRGAQPYAVIRQEIEKLLPPSQIE